MYIGAATFSNQLKVKCVHNPYFPLKLVPYSPNFCANVFVNHVNLMISSQNFVVKFS